MSKRRSTASSGASYTPDWTVDSLGYLLSLLFHGGLILLLFFLRVPVSHQPPKQFNVHFKVAELKPETPIKLVFVSPNRQQAPAPKRQHEMRREHRLKPTVQRIIPPPQPALTRPVVKHGVLHAVNTVHKTNSTTPRAKKMLPSLTNVQIAKRPEHDAVEPTFSPRLPDPLDTPHVLSDIRSTGIHLPDGMRLDRDTKPQPVRDLPHGVPMDQLPRHREDRTNGEGNSHQNAEPGPKMALLDRRNGMGLDTFKPAPFSAGGGHTSEAGASDPRPGEGGIPDLAGVADRLGSAEPSAHSGGGPVGFAGPTGKQRPGLTDIITAPTSDWKLPLSSGAGGSLGKGASGRSGRGGGGVGGPDSPFGAFSMRARGGGGAGEGAGGGLGGGIGTGVGRGYGAGVGGGDGQGGGGGGAGRGRSVGAGWGRGRPGTLGDGVPDGIGEGGGGGRTGLFRRGGGGSPQPAAANPGQNIVAYEVGCVLTNQNPPFNAAHWHAYSMTELLQYVGRSAHIRVRIPRSTIDSYVNLRDGDINDPRPFSYEDIRGYPMIFMTGDRFFTLSNSERAALRRYVYEDGGTIYGEDCHAPDGSKRRGGFDAPFREYMEQIFGKPLQQIPLGNMIYHMKFDINQMPSGDCLESDLFDGIHINGRWAVVYTINDYGDVWSPIHHYYPASLRPPAYRIGTDLYLYALSNYLEFHRTHEAG